MWGAPQHGTTVGFVASLSLPKLQFAPERAGSTERERNPGYFYAQLLGGAEGSRDHLEQEILPVFEKPACAVQRPSKVTQSHTDAQLER